MPQQPSNELGGCLRRKFSPSAAPKPPPTDGAAGFCRELRRRRNNGLLPRRIDLAGCAIHSPGLYPGNDTEAYRLRAWIHDYLN